MLCIILYYVTLQRGKPSWNAMNSFLICFYKHRNNYKYRKIILIKPTKFSKIIIIMYISYYFYNYISLIFMIYSLFKITLNYNRA